MNYKSFAERTKDKTFDELVHEGKRRAHELIEGGLIMERYIDPTTDFGFKKLFGEEANKDIIMSFIQDVLELEKPLSEITFLDKEQLPESSEERIGVYDIFCKNEDGSYFIVEMQKNKIDFMKDRMVYYSTFPIVAQAKRGRIPVEINGKRREIPWDYELSPIYCIAILDFAFNEEDAACVKRNSIRDDKPPYNLFYDKLRYITIELPLFDERKPECSLDKHLNKWLYFLKELPNFEEMPEIFKGDIIFEKTFEVAEIAKFTKEERRYYEQSLKRSRDSYAIIKYAKKEVKEERTIEIARSMLQKKMDISLISELTGLSEEEIAKLED